MSEYQYYEFQAIDRPLSELDRKALRAMSTRAKITATSFTNSYEWGDFKGDPLNLMERFFDLHLYLANWGTRRLAIRLPRRLIDPRRLNDFLAKVECAELSALGENLVLDILREDLEPEDDWDDGSDWLDSLAPLRADVLSGDLRCFYLQWLTAVEADALEPGETEPLPGIGPMTDALETFAQFFHINADLVTAAAERPAGPVAPEPSSAEIRRIVAALPEGEKTRLLTRMASGDPHVSSEMRALVRDRLAREVFTPAVVPRSVNELRARAQAVRRARERAETDRQVAEQKRLAEEAERSRRARLDAIARRSESVWREIEAEILRRNVTGYAKAAGLLLDLKTIAEEGGTTEDFTRRLDAIRARHVRKQRLIELLNALG